jgi:hypothetical protein
MYASYLVENAPETSELLKVAFGEQWELFTHFLRSKQGDIMLRKC